MDDEVASADEIVDFSFESFEEPDVVAVNCEIVDFLFATVPLSETVQVDDVHLFAL